MTSRPGELLLLGGAGRMGRLLARHFRARGHRVLVNDPGGRLPGFATAPLEAAARASVVVLSVPLHATAHALDAVLALRPRGLVFDVASVKAPLVPALTRAAAEGLAVASVHPMFGPSVRSLVGHDLIVCDAGNARAARKARALFDGAGLHLSTIPLAEHDPWVARTLGLAHLVALAASSTLAALRVDVASLDGLASTSFRNLVRLSGPILDQAPELTRAIQALNSETPAMMDALARELASWRELFLGEDPTAFVAKLAAAREAMHRQGGGLVEAPRGDAGRRPAPRTRP